jgi:hypothetical protein
MFGMSVNQSEDGRMGQDMSWGVADIWLMWVVLGWLADVWVMEGGFVHDAARLRVASCHQVEGLSGEVPVNGTVARRRMPAVRT